MPELEALVGQHPMREVFVAQLMTALYRSGRQADALRAFRTHREVLVEELGLDPTAALSDLEQRILAQDPALQGEAPGGQALRGYRLGERLGTGRDGTVHAAHLPGVDRELVIRVIRPELADWPDFVRAFEATAQRIASLRHPAIVPIHDYWREPGAAYLVLRRMHGGSLADRLERLDRRPFTAADVTAMVRRIGAALVAAGEAGLTHGRVDPRSVLFDEAGDAWLTDFDLTEPGRDPGIRRPRSGRARPGLPAGCHRRRRRRDRARHVARRPPVDGPVRPAARRPRWPAAGSKAPLPPRTRTRGCGPSTRPTHPTSSVGPPWSTTSSAGSVATS